MLLMFGVFVMVLAADHVSKALISARLKEGSATLATVCGVRLRHVVNRRKPWGSQRGVTAMTLVWAFLVFAACLAASLIDNNAVYIAMGTIMAGATGNLMDGVSRHAVTDFIDIRVWPVFNLADAAIVCGAAFLVWNAGWLLL